MIVYIGADHRGFDLKEQLKVWMKDEGFNVEDLGAENKDPEDDYPEYAGKVAERASEDPDSRGVVICGSGVGVDIVANKFDTIRSGLGISAEQVKAAREDDDINILSIASDFTDFEKAKELIRIFLETEYKSEERFERRIGQITEIEEEN